MTGTKILIRSNGQITFPASVRRKAKLHDGDLLNAIIESDGSLRLIPLNAIPKGQLYFWTKRWQTGERKAGADIKADRMKKFEDVGDALNWLDRGR